MDRHWIPIFAVFAILACLWGVSSGAAPLVKASKSAKGLTSPARYNVMKLRDQIDDEDRSVRVLSKYALCGSCLFNGTLMHPAPSTDCTKFDLIGHEWLEANDYRYQTIRCPSQLQFSVDTCSCESREGVRCKC